MEESAQKQKPPKGDVKKAQKYIDRLVELIESNRIQASQTDLSRFDPSAFRDHYKVDLKEYEIEISHSKTPNGGDDVYMMVFTNLQKIRETQESAEEKIAKVILAYTRLTPEQFGQFKSVAQKQIEETHRREEEQRFEEAVKPIDDILDNTESVAGNLPVESPITYGSSQVDEEDSQVESALPNESKTPTMPEPQLKISDNNFDLKEYDINPLNTSSPIENESQTKQSQPE